MGEPPLFNGSDQFTPIDVFDYEYKVGVRTCPGIVAAIMLTVPDISLSPNSLTAFTENL